MLSNPDCTRRSLLGRGALAATAAVTAPVALQTAEAAAAAPRTAAPRDRIAVWRGLDAWRSEVVTFDLDGRGIVAQGTQVGFAPMPYRLEYSLDASPDFITRRLLLTAEGAGWMRHLDLRSNGRGAWTAKARKSGKVDLPEPGGDTSAFAGALDCDLGYSPLTNMMPIRRSGLARRPGAEDFLMAWVSVPDLSVVASPQRYEHVSPSVVRYVDRGLFPGFTAVLQLDASGMVEVYPDLAKQVEPRRPR